MSAWDNVEPSRWRLIVEEPEQRAERAWAWIVWSMALWALDAITTVWALNVGMAEGSPFSAWAQSHLGVAGYAVVLFPVLLLRGLLAAQQGQSIGWRVARTGCRALIVIHVFVVANNVFLLTTFYAWGK